MTKRLATMCLVTVFSIAIGSTFVQAQSTDTEATRVSLKDIRVLNVTIEYLPDGAKKLGLTRDAIQTDVELKLRLAGIRVVTDQEDIKLPGMPTLYIQVALTDNAEAASIEVELLQNVKLDRNDQLVTSVPTWRTSGGLLSNPLAQSIRNAVKDHIDIFLNAWLSVNPKK